MARLVLAALLLAGCGARDVPACLERCADLSIERPLCQTLCTTSCRSLHDKYGISRDRCEAIQTGEPSVEPEPGPTKVP